MIDFNLTFAVYLNAAACLLYVFDHFCVVVSLFLYSHVILLLIIVFLFSGMVYACSYMYVCGDFMINGYTHVTARHLFMFLQ